MSRALDPQLHTHVVAANLACGPDGRFTALHSSKLYREAKTAGFLYQAHLRALVSERVGLEWGPVTNGAAELTGVARGVIEFFSKRRTEMQRAAAAGGIALDSKGAAESAALATRERKQYGVETHTWREEVRACAAEQGLDGEEVTQLLEAGLEHVSDPTTGRLAVDEEALGEHLAGPAGLTERSNTFDARPVLQEFAAAAQAGALVGEVRDMARRFTARTDVLATTRGEMTTAELVGMERRLIAAAMGRAGEQCCVVEEQLIERSIAAADRVLTAMQAKAVREVTGSGHGVSVIKALAGTGKTYTAGVLREVYEAAGIQVIGVAPTGRAARELTEEAGIPARTLDRLLTELEKFDQALPQGCVVVLDEAGMAATRASAKLLEAAQRAGAKVVAIGDPGQLASVQAGGWLGKVGRRLRAVRLTEVMRQRDPAERRALAALHDREPAPYLEWADQAGRIETFEEPDAAREQALAEWTTAAAEVGPAQAVMIARENELRDELNHAARELRKEQGALGEERDYGPVQLAVGDRVICRRNDRGVDVDNGMRGTVRHLDANTVTIDTDGGLVRKLPAAYVQEHVEHAYSLTGHGMQGGTVQTAIVVASPRDLSAGWSYTALSRARGETRLLVYEESLERERSGFAPPDETEKATREELLARTEQRMSERDDEDLAIEQLPAPTESAGRPDDPRLIRPSTLTNEPPQERAATHAEPNQPESPPSTARLAELREQIEQLKAQQAALPARELRRIDDLEARANTLEAKARAAHRAPRRPPRADTPLGPRTRPPGSRTRPPPNSPPSHRARPENNPHRPRPPRTRPRRQPNRSPHRTRRPQTRPHQPDPRTTNPRSPNPHRPPPRLPASHRARRRPRPRALTAALYRLYSRLTIQTAVKGDDGQGLADRLAEASSDRRPSRSGAKMAGSPPQSCKPSAGILRPPRPVTVMLDQRPRSLPISKLSISSHARRCVLIRFTTATPDDATSIPTWNAR